MLRQVTPRGGVARIVKQLLFGVVALCGAAAAPAQNYPVKPVRIIVPFVPGGGSDTIARGVASGLTERLGQPFVVENRGGANTIIGTEYVANQPPDGYTILLCTGSLATNPSLYKQLKYDPVKSFTPIGLMLWGSSLLVVHPSLPVHNVKELIAFARANPGKLTYTSYGTGSPAHLAGELFGIMTGSEMLHVPFKGSSPAITEVVSGRASMTFGVMVPTLPFVKSGRLRPLGVASPTRNPRYPEFPTIAESGLPGYEAQGFNGLCGPAGMPKEIVAKLNSALSDFLAAKETREKFLTLGFNMLERPTSPEEFGNIIRAQTEKWAKVIKTAGIKVE
ncbi:MAG: tripartite tricarboxylate transporter substrate binding protein [Burkholderiales bacterium]